MHKDHKKVEDPTLKETKQILRSLANTYPRGIQSSQFTQEYYNLVGSSIPYKSFGYNNVHDFLMNIPDTIQVIISSVLIFFRKIHRIINNFFVY